VNVEFAVSQGGQYRLNGLEWIGNKVVAADQLNSFLRAHSGEVANTVQLGADLDRVRQLYGSLGYIRATVRPEGKFDESSGTVKYSLTIIEDERYKMGELDIRGVDRTQESKLRELWRLHPGDVYDAGYLQAYLPQAVKMLPRNFDWTTTHHVTANVKDKTVDVEIHFTAQAPK
jgi:outer membrane protein assembly factor BamA